MIGDSVRSAVGDLRRTDGKPEIASCVGEFVAGSRSLASFIIYLLNYCVHQSYFFCGAAAQSVTGAEIVNPGLLCAYS